ncbi:MAG TPA: hypothetical protein VGL50_01075 [Steroidobacteraceae bacterium]|jgi:hypothetical protein
MSNQPVLEAMAVGAHAAQPQARLARSAALALTLTVSVGLTACGMHWPWKHRAAPAPRPVHELTIEGDGTIAQYWDRNTLQLDLTAVAGEGSATLRAPHGWPVRLEFKVRPGSFGMLEVEAVQRTVFEVPAQGSAAVLKVAPGTYASDTPAIAIRWSAAAGSAH